MVSLIIPTYNEEGGIARALRQLRRVRGHFEVIVADSESTDSTRSVVESLRGGFPHPLRIVVGQGNRAVELNRAAAEARGSVLLFLHADALLAEDAIESLERALADPSIVGGDYRLAFEGRSFWSRLFTGVHRIRRKFGIYYGDSGLFVRRDFFERLGGFAPVPIMDDYHFIRRMERCGRTICLPSLIRVSDRRWRVAGVLRTLLTWFWVQGLYSLGVPPRHLARWYRPVRKAAEERPRSAAAAADEV